MTEYIDSTRGLKAFLLRVLQAHKDGLLNSHWFGESSKRANLSINEWYVVGGVRKQYSFVNDLIRDVYANLDKVTEEEIVALADNIEYRNVLLGERGRAFFMANYKKPSEKTAPAPTPVVEAEEEPAVVDEPVVEQEPAPKKRGKAKKA